MSGLLGAILAGGRSSRFGSDKAMALLDGRPLIDWVRDALEPHVDAIILCGRAGGIADRPCPDMGPLGGINAALHHAASLGFRAVMTMPCDVPVLPPDILRRLAGAGTSAYLDALPVVGYWTADTADLLDIHLKGKERSVVGWAKRIGAQPISAGVEISNVNTCADLASLAERRG